MTFTAGQLDYAKRLIEIACSEYDWAAKYPDDDTVRADHLAHCIAAVAAAQASLREIFQGLVFMVKP
jgi:hypothetical protein